MSTCRSFEALIKFIRGQFVNTVDSEMDRSMIQTPSSEMGTNTLRNYLMHSENEGTGGSIKNLASVSEDSRQAQLPLDAIEERERQRRGKMLPKSGSS